VNCGASFTQPFTQQEGATASKTAPRVTSQELRELADWYQDESHRRYNENRLDVDELDAVLRAKLRGKVPPEQVEAAFEEVMKLVFAV
jgi:hypothetical protein